MVWSSSSYLNQVTDVLHNPDENRRPTRDTRLVAASEVFIFLPAIVPIRNVSRCFFRAFLDIFTLLLTVGTVSHLE